MIKNKSEKNKSFNFLLLRLGDSDFCSELILAISEFSDFALTEGIPSVRLKRAIVQHIVGSMVSKEALSVRDASIDWNRYQDIEEYLNKKLTIDFTKNRTCEDHDGGSAYFDFNLKKAFRC